VGELYAGIHRRHGVDLRTGTTVERWHVQGDRVTGAALSDGTDESFDLALVAVGIEPNLDLPHALGLPLDGGGVRADTALRAADNVYVGGDVAYHHHPVLDRSIRVEHWEVAKGQGRGIAVSIAAGATPYTKLPYFWSDQYDVNLEYRGNASGDDVAVWRGDVEALKFTVFYLRGGLVEGVLSMNDSDTNEQGGKLIESRRKYEPSALRSADLEELIPAGQAG
jgi:NADPH-dependent 2,4-dienoyl-CoA reductase/sulfur reductase-like enzyme